MDHIHSLLCKYSKFSQLDIKKLLKFYYKTNVFRNFDAQIVNKMSVNSPYLKKFWTLLSVLLLFFVVSALYFAPQLSGDKLIQHDVQQYEGMSKDILLERELSGEDAQWTGRMFGGMPAFLINVKYPAQAVKGTIGKISNIVDIPISLMFFAMTAMWVAMLLFGVNPWIGVVAALAYGLSTYFLLIIGAGHITKMWAAVYAPLMVAGCYYTLRKNMWTGAVLTALFTSLEIGANHPQISYYFLLVMVAMWLSEAIYSYRQSRVKDFLKRTAVLVAAGVVALGSNLSPLWYTMQHTKETTRGGSELVEQGAKSGQQGLDIEYATAWSYGRSESMNMFIPDLMGGASTDTFSEDGAVAEELKQYGLEDWATMLPRYHGEQPYTAGPTYLGAAVIFLAIFALFVLPARQRWWIVGVSLLALFMSWGYHMMWFSELLFKYLPGYDKFRAVSTALVILQWSIPLLAALGLGELLSKEADEKRLRRALNWALGLSLGVLVVVIVGGKGLGDFGMQQSGEQMSEQFRQILSEEDGGQKYIKQGMHEQMGWGVASAMAEERADAMQADAWRSLLFVLLAACALAGYIYRKIILKPWVLCAVLSVVVVADLVDVDMRYLSHESFVSARQAKILPTDADKAILQDKDLGYRVLNLTVSPFNDATTSYFHRSVGGYHGAKLSRYQDMIDHYLSKMDEGVLDMLNVRYIIAGEKAEDVVPRQSALGAAWMVQNVVRATSAAEEIALVGQVDKRNVAVVSEEFMPEKLSFGQGEIRLVEYHPQYLKYEYEADADALAIFSEIYTRQGWSAKIDGVEVAPLRADYILRALELPQGKHTVEWHYRAPRWSLVEGITLAFSLTILVSLVLILIYYIRNARRQKNQA